MNDAAQKQRNRLKGIALMCGAVACFAVLDAMAKYLGGHMDTLQVVAMRYISAFLLTFVLFNPVSRPGMLRTKAPWPEGTGPWSDLHGRADGRRSHGSVAA